MSILSTIGSALSSAFSGATVYIMIAVAAISAGGSGYTVYKIEHSKVAVLQMQNQQCLDANLSSAATVTALKKERANANATCQKQLAIQNDAIIQCHSLLDMKGATNEKPSASSSGDLVLDRINGVYPKAGGQGSVCSSGSGTSTDKNTGLGSGVLLRRYCFQSVQDAINWLEDINVHRSYELQMEAIINSHQTPTSTR
jgi:hypothetical protein